MASQIGPNLIMSGSLAIAVDLGGTQVRAALVAKDATVHSQLIENTHASSGGHVVLEQIREMIGTLAGKVSAASVLGVGLCAPGPLDAQSGIALSTPTINGFSDLPIGQLLSDGLPWDVQVENDGIAAAQGEWKHGAGQGQENLVYVTISTGIGGGVVADGQILHGRKGMAGHIGHMTIVADGVLCPCGNKGCWEAYASGTAFTARANEVRNEDGVVTSAKSIFDDARRGAKYAVELVDQEAEFLGIGITNLLHLYSPDIVILGGGMAKDFDMLEPGISRHVTKCAMPPFRDVPIVPATLESSSGLVGVASMVFTAHSS
ncbi:MAG: ROK family protein [Hyphomicrobiales bacterium]